MGRRWGRRGKGGQQRGGRGRGRKGSRAIRAVCATAILPRGYGRFLDDHFVAGIHPPNPHSFERCVAVFPTLPHVVGKPNSYDTAHVARSNGSQGVLPARAFAIVAAYPASQHGGQVFLYGLPLAQRRWQRRWHGRVLIRAVRVLALFLWAVWEIAHGRSPIPIPSSIPMRGLVLGGKEGRVQRGGQSSGLLLPCSSLLLLCGGGGCAAT